MPTDILFPASVVLCDSDAQKVRDHKYSPGVYTPLDNAMNGFWLWSASCMPRWLAPNMITLIGTVIAYLGLAVCIVCRGQSVSYFTTAIAIFLYQTLDAIDGKHARAIGLSTPLGAIFDHGCDAAVMPIMGALLLNCVFPELLQPESISGPIEHSTRLAFYAALSCLVGFWTTQWEELQTGSLQHMGITEAQMLAISVALITGVFTPSVWLTDIGFSFKLRDIICLMTCLSGSFVFANSLWRGLRKKQSYDFMKAVKALMPVVLFALSAVAAFDKTNLFSMSPLMFYASTTIAYSVITMITVVGNVAKKDTSTLGIIGVSPFTAVAAVAAYYPSWAFTTQTIATLYQLVGFVLLVLNSCSSLSVFLSIPLLSVPHSLLKKTQ